MKNLVFYILLFIWSFTIEAQNITYSKKIINDLCSVKFQGRGYVNNGVNLAAEYLEAEMSRLKLKKFGNQFTQTYSFSVNTHPYRILCKLDDQIQAVGIDFLIDAGSSTIQGKYKLLHFNLQDSLDKILLFKKISKGFQLDEALVLHHLSARENFVFDSCEAYNQLPALFIRTEAKKLTHTISQQLDKYNTLIYMDSVIANKEIIEIEAKNEFLETFSSKNLIGYIEGEKTNSFVVFSAHYDHLGMQGHEAMFPGASDNASGVSMLFYLADYYSKHKPLYNTVFILFSGEEAGLLGSEYFTKHPTFNLQKIKMLVNIDIVGNAEKGIVVVNGELFKKQFEQLQFINSSKKYLPEVRIRGKAKNSDHYYFSEMGIPSFFIYSNGGVGFYHDVFDVANSIDLTNYENVAKLLIEFSGEAKKKIVKKKKKRWWRKGT